jgi:hypothetical protein
MKSVVITQQIELGGKVYYPGAAVVSDTEATALDDADALTGEPAVYNFTSQSETNAFLSAIPAVGVDPTDADPLTAIGAVFADLAAARTAVNTMRTEVEARLAALEVQGNDVVTKLTTVGILAEVEA